MSGTPPWKLELEVYQKITRGEYACGLSHDCKDFSAMVLWANPSMVSKYPIMAALARGEFSGVAADATSERTFSYSGRVFSTLRRKMTMANLCGMVVGASFHRPVSDAEIMDEYESRREKSERREAAAAAAVAAAEDEDESDDDDY